MVTLDRLLALVYEAVDEINLQLPKGQRLKKEPGSVLLGKHSELESLTVVNLLSTIEDKVEDAFGRRVTLLDEQYFASGEQTLSTLGSLVDKLASKLN